MNGFPRWSCMRPRVVVGIALFMNAFGSANAYEITTHALITQVAQQRSVLNSANANAITPIVGFDRLAIDAPMRARASPIFRPCLRRTLAFCSSRSGARLQA